MDIPALLDAIVGQVKQVDGVSAPEMLRERILRAALPSDPIVTS